MVKVLIFLAAIAVLVRASPVPACQWDEVIAGCFAAPTEDLAAGEHSTGPRYTSPSGNDSPEDVVRDQIAHQSLGQVQPAPTSVTSHDAAATESLIVQLPVPLHVCSLSDLTIRLVASAVFPSSALQVRSHPLLI